MQFQSSPDYLLISQAAAVAFAAVRLLQFSLAQKFPLLFSYLIVTAASDSLLSVLARKSVAYYWTFMIASPCTWVVASLAVFEMFSLIFRDFPGLKTGGRWVLYAALTLSIVISLAIIRRPPRTDVTANTHHVYYELVFDRSVHFSLAVIILILMLFLSRYPLHLDRNTLVASGFFSAVFLAQSAVRLIDTLTRDLFAHYADNPELIFSAICFLGWGLMLRSSRATTPVRTPVNKPRETELLQQLESLNNILTRSVRR